VCMLTKPLSWEVDNREEIPVVIDDEKGQWIHDTSEVWVVAIVTWCGRVKSCLQCPCQWYKILIGVDKIFWSTITEWMWYDTKIHQNIIHQVKF